MTLRLLLLTLLLAAPAAAQDAAPVVSALVAGGDRPATVAALSTGVTTVEAGALLTLVGSGLPTTDGVDRALQVPGLRVTLDHSPLTILHSEPTQIVVRLGLFERPGASMLRVEYGRRTLAQFRLAIEERTRPTWPTTADLVIGFQVTRFELVRDAEGDRFVAEGTTAELSDGAFVDVTLEQDASPLATHKVWIRANRWRRTFGPYADGQLLAGEYVVSLRFASARQPRRLGSAHPFYDDVVRRRSLRLGTPLLAALQRRDRHAPLLAASARAELLLLEAEEALAASPLRGLAEHARWVETRFLPQLDRLRRDEPLHARLLAELRDLVVGRSRALLATAGRPIPEALTPVRVLPSRAAVLATRSEWLRSVGLEAP